MKNLRSTRRAIQHRIAQRKMIEKLEPLLAKAYAQSIADLKGGVNQSKVAERLQANDIDGALAALHIEPAAFLPLRKALIASFEAGGRLAMMTLPTIVAVKRG